MNKQDSGKFVAALTSMISWRNMFKNHKTFTAPKARYEKHKMTSSGRSGIPTNQKIRMAQNRKDRIALKKRVAAKRILLKVRKMKKDAIPINN